MGKQRQPRSSRPKVSGNEEQKSSGAAIPLWVAIIGGIFTLLGIALTAYFNSIQHPPVSTPTVMVQATQVVTPKPGTCPDDMALIPSGTFWMGAVQGDNDAQQDEKPGKSVKLDVFCIDRMEVSNEQYAQFVNDAKHRPPPAAVPVEPDSWVGTSPPPGYATYPVVRVSWFDAKGYCEWKGRGLPTEAQWEKAARGLTNWIYPWGNTWDSGRANGGKKGASLQPVDSYFNGKSPYGVLNMAGNAAEWVADQYQQDWYSIMPDSNPNGPTNGSTQVVRGGSFVEAPERLRVSARADFLPNFPNLAALKNIGFRCAQHSYG